MLYAIFTRKHRQNSTEVADPHVLLDTLEIVTLLH